MSYKLNPEQYNSVVSLDSAARCRHFIARVADWQCLWGVRSPEGWLVPQAPEGFDYLPVWPHPGYAQTIADKIFTGNLATAILLEDFMEGWLPKLAEDKVMIAIFPNQNWEFWVMEPEGLSTALMCELAKYEE
jgi:hypothetical protein